jgi:hypothetical protein
LIYARPKHPIATPLLVKFASIPRRSAIDRLASETSDRVNETRLRRARFRRPNREAALRINLKSTGAPPNELAPFPLNISPPAFPRTDYALFADAESAAKDWP